MNVGGPAWQVSALTRGLDPDRYVTRLICGEVDGTEADYVDLRDHPPADDEVERLRRFNSFGPPSAVPKRDQSGLTLRTRFRSLPISLSLSPIPSRRW